MKELIIGGTSGLGLEMAKLAQANDHDVIVTGRHDPQQEGIEYQRFDLDGGNTARRIEEFVAGIPQVDSLVYAPGFYQEGHIANLSDEQVDEMIDVCGRGLIFFVKKLLEKQGILPELVTVTSTSQWTPREFEPVYNFAKAGAGHFSNALSLDPNVSKTMVVGPSGMDSGFWRNSGRDTSNMLPTKWVAGQIAELRKDDYSYRFARVLGAFGDLPNRVELVETR